MKQSASILISILCPLLALSQHPTRTLVKGKIYDIQTHKALSGASIICFSAKDSSKVSTRLADANGAFIFDSLLASKYYLQVTYLGYKTIYHSLNTQEDTTDSINIHMRKEEFLLSPVDIIETTYGVKIKKDTIEFSTARFKTRKNAMLEELLKRLPGVRVDNDGTIRINGEIVKTILVDGRPFFIDDPKLATKNLQIDMIDKVQLIDRKISERDPGTFNDTQTEKTINITIKKEKRNKIIGQVTSGYGTNNRFSVNTNINRFREHDQLTFLGNGNNINGYNGKGSIGNGLVRSWNEGLNYNRDINKKITLNSSYLVEDTHKDEQKFSARKNFLGDSSNYYNQKSYSTDKIITHNINTRLDYRVDSLQTIIVNGMLGYYSGNSKQESEYETYNVGQQFINSGKSVNKQKSKSYNTSLSVTYVKNFSLPNRSLNISIDYYNGYNDGIGYNSSTTLFVTPMGENKGDTLNQQNSTNGRSRQLQLKINYSEPILKNKSLKVSYGLASSQIPSDKIVHDYNPIKMKYSEINDSMSNKFKTTTLTHYARIGLHAQQSKYDYNISIVGLARFMTNESSNQSKNIRLYTSSLLPKVYANYMISNGKKIKFNYIVNPGDPIAEQLQPVPDNSNPLYIRKGNPNLKPEKNHLLTLAYSSIKSSLYNVILNINGRFTRDHIIYATWMDSLGRQINQPINVNGNYETRIEMGINFPIRRQSSLNTNTSIGINRGINYTNDLKGKSQNILAIQSINYFYSYKDIFDVSTTAVINYNQLQYLNQDNINNFISYNFSFDGSINLPKGIVLGSNLSYMRSSGQSQGYNTNNIMLNASLSKIIFSKDRGLIKLQGYDILNQNTSIIQNFGSNYIEDVHTLTLQRYVLFSFTYFLNGK